MAQACALAVGVLGRTVLSRVSSGASRRNPSLRAQEDAFYPQLTQRQAMATLDERAVPSSPRAHKSAQTVPPTQF